MVEKANANKPILFGLVAGVTLLGAAILYRYYSKDAKSGKPR